MLWVLQDDLFSGEFCLGVNTQRIRLIGFDVVTFLAVEYQIGGEESEANILREFGEVRGCVNVYLAGESWVRLAIGTPSHRGGVDYEIGFVLAEASGDGGEIGEIKFMAR